MSSSLQVRDVLPEFVDELVALVEASSRPELADRIPTLEVMDRCRCGDRNCAHFYTAPRPAGAHPEGHANVLLSARRGLSPRNARDRVGTRGQSPNVG